MIGVSRVSSPAMRERLAAWGVDTISCDLLQEDQVQRLPEAPLVISMTGLKSAQHPIQPCHGP